MRMMIAHIWDWLFPRSCWAESAAWAMRVPGCRLHREADGRGTSGYCPDGVNTCVGCWCGKFRGTGEKGQDGGAVKVQGGERWAVRKEGRVS